MLVEPQGKAVLDHARYERGAFARAEPFLGLARELRVLHLDRQHEADTFPDVLGRELDAPRQ